MDGGGGATDPHCSCYMGSITSQHWSGRWGGGDICHLAPMSHIPETHQPAPTVISHGGLSQGLGYIRSQVKKLLYPYSVT